VVGKLFVDGGWDVRVKGRSAAATLTTPTALTFAPSCDSRITAGVVEASYTVAGQQASISVEWSGCGNRTVDYQPGE